MYETFRLRRVYVISLFLSNLAYFHEDYRKNLLVVARRIKECPLACVVSLKTLPWFEFGAMVAAVDRE